MHAPLAVALRLTTLRGVTEDLAPAGRQPAAAGPGVSPRTLLVPLALAQFICSFAGSNMNVMINDISEDLDTTV